MSISISVRKCVLSGMVLLLTGCSTALHTSTPVSLSTANTVSTLQQCIDCHWSAVRVRILPLSGAEPQWEIDSVLAGEVFAPVLAKVGSALPLWRFHRRAALDATGHQFSFIFFAPPEVSNQIAEALGSMQILSQLQSQGIIEQWVIDSVGAERSATIEGSSDSAWPIALQRSWPHYILGVSNAWLDLTRQVLVRPPASEADNVQSTIAAYRNAALEVARIWKVSGQHAFFHHLSAMMGYEPVIIKREIQF